MKNKQNRAVFGVHLLFRCKSPELPILISLNPHDHQINSAHFHYLHFMSIHLIYDSINHFILYLSEQFHPHPSHLLKLSFARESVRLFLPISAAAAAIQSIFSAPIEAQRTDQTCSIDAGGGSDTQKITSQWFLYRRGGRTGPDRWTSGSGSGAAGTFAIKTCTASVGGSD